MSCSCKPRRANCNTCFGNKKVTVVKEINHMAGINTAIIDDANEKVYFYGNVQHESFHVPAAECQPYVIVPGSYENYNQLLPKTETFEGDFADNTIILAERPDRARHMFVFLNGAHQDEGQEFDYVLDRNELKFMTHNLITTDRVTVKYFYVGVQS